MIMHNAGLIPSEYNAKTPDGYFNFCVPLSILLNFCEDYKRVVINAHKLILIRACNDNNCIMGDQATENGERLVILDKINELPMLRTLESGRYLSMSFHSWNLYEYSLLQNMINHS